MTFYLGPVTLNNYILQQFKGVAVQMGLCYVASACLAVFTVLLLGEDLPWTGAGQRLGGLGHGRLPPVRHVLRLGQSSHSNRDSGRRKRESAREVGLPFLKGQLMEILINTGIFFLGFHTLGIISAYRNNIIKSLMSVPFLLLKQASEESEYLKVKTVIK